MTTPTPTAPSAEQSAIDFLKGILKTAPFSDEFTVPNAQNLKNRAYVCMAIAALSQSSEAQRAVEAIEDILSETDKVTEVVISEDRRCGVPEYVFEIVAGGEEGSDYYSASTIPAAILSAASQLPRPK